MLLAEAQDLCDGCLEFPKLPSLKSSYQLHASSQLSQQHSYLDLNPSVCSPHCSSFLHLIPAQSKLTHHEFTAIDHSLSATCTVGVHLSGRLEQNMQATGLNVEDTCQEHNMLGHCQFHLVYCCMHALQPLKCIEFTRQKDRAPR